MKFTVDTKKIEPLRLGQKLCNYIHSMGYPNEKVHIALFHMQDDEFEYALREDNKTLHERFDKEAPKVGKYPG